MAILPQSTRTPIPDLFPPRLYRLYTQIDTDELLEVLREAEKGDWMGKAKKWVALGARKAWHLFAEDYPTLATVPSVLAIYTEESVARVKNVDGKFLALKVFTLLL